MLFSCDVEWKKAGWKVIKKIAATLKNEDSIILGEKKTNLYLRYDFKCAQVKKCISAYIRELEECGKIKIEQLQCLLARSGSETTVISDFGDRFV